MTISDGADISCGGSTKRMAPPKAVVEERSAAVASATRATTETARHSRLSELAHELRGPLAAIQNYCEILLDHPPSDDGQRRLFLSTVADEAARLNRLLDDLIDIERLETTSHAVPPARCDVAFAVERALLALHPLASAKRIEVTSAVEAPDGAVWADPSLLERAIFLIAENAVRFSHEETAVNIEVKGVGDQCQVTIDDTGIGVPEDYREQIFGKFFKAAIPPDAISPQGSGIGLTLARAIARLYGGDVVCLEKPGGTRFRLWLPLR